MLEGGNAGLLARDAAVFFRQSGSTPCLAAIRKAEGIWLEDADGHRIMDFHGNNAHHVGYGHPRVLAAVERQLRSLPFTPRRFTDAPAIALAERLTAAWPGGEGRVLLATGGSDAVEIALKIARAATGRYKTISFFGSYHGSGFGALSLGGRALDRTPRIGPLLPGALHVPPFYRPAAAKEQGGDADSWARLSLASMHQVFLHEPDIAAVIAEPIRSAPYLPPDWYWPEVRALCDRHGALLVFDEIPTGLGKVGTLFASETVGVAPDLTVLGKALGGGLLPIAAVIGHARLDVAEELTLGHYTHEKNPVTTAAALATLEILQDERLPERAAALGAEALRRLRALAARQPVIEAVRGRGLLLAFDFAGPPAAAGAKAARLGEDLLRRGLSVSASGDGVVTLSPPLVITAAELAQALALIEAGVERLAASE